MSEKQMVLRLAGVATGAGFLAGVGFMVALSNMMGWF